MAVARAGICAALPARTAMLGAANPVGGGWNRAKTVQQNLGLSGAMLSRFDLLFVMRDAPDAALDQRLSEHVLAMHSGEIHMLEPSGICCMQLWLSRILLRSGRCEQVTKRTMGILLRRIQVQI